MSDKKLSVWRCSRCHEQRAVGEYHWHKDTETYVPAEKVEVIPVAEGERLEAERDTAKKQRDDLYIEREECWKTIDRMAEQRRLVRIGPT